MGKYIKGRGALGTRTRAQALAQQRGDSSFRKLSHELDSPHSLLSNHVSSGNPASSSYMQLRSRIVHNSAKHPLKQTHTSDNYIQSSLKEHIHGGSAEEHNIHSSAKESPLARKRSLRNSGSLPIRECVMTRNKNRKHEEAEKMDRAESEFYGENGSVDARVSSKDSHSYNCSCSYSHNHSHSHSHSKDAGGSTSRLRHSSYGACAFSADSAPSSTEIDAFFQGSEHRERRRFIDSYNFDPKNERPLRGRFEWTRML